MQRDGIDAESQPTRHWSIWEHMAEVSSAHIAGHLDSVHAVADILMVGHKPWRDGLRETRPPCIALILGRRIKEFCAATKTLVPTRFEESTEL